MLNATYQSLQLTGKVWFGICCVCLSNNKNPVIKPNDPHSPLPLSPHPAFGKGEELLEPGSVLGKVRRDYRSQPGHHQAIR